MTTEDLVGNSQSEEVRSEEEARLRASALSEAMVARILQAWDQSVGSAPPVECRRRAAEAIAERSLALHEVVAGIPTPLRFAVPSLELPTIEPKEGGRGLRPGMG